MINAYKQGKDLYATIASGVYNNEYRLNLEYATNPDGSAQLDENGEKILYLEGKKRRSNCKKLLLGIMYGMGPSKIAEDIGGTVKEAQKIIDDFYTGFPKVKKWMDDTRDSAKRLGYVEDIWGRRRRLPDIQLPRFEISLKDESKSNLPINFNPILGTKGIITKQKSPALVKYENLLESSKNKRDVESLKTQAALEGVIIKENGGFIAQAERQCVNARIQGGAASMSKRAMIKVHHDPILNELGFKLCLAVHDELIGQCPEENAEKASQRLADLMKVAAEPEVKVPFKCDPSIEPVWYYADYSASVKEHYEDKLAKGLSKEAALSEIFIDHCECTEQQIVEILGFSA